MSTVGERVAWRSRVENADQRLLLTALGMLTDDSLRVTFSLEALGRITLQSEDTIRKTLQRLTKLGILRPIVGAAGLYSYRLRVAGLNFSAKGQRLTPADTTRFIDALGGSCAVARIFHVNTSTVCSWRHLGMPVEYLRF